MSQQELHLTLERARAGMRLARDLLDARGQVLMTQDTELSDATIAALHRRNVTELWVINPQPQITELKAQEAARRQHHRERLARLFRNTGESADGRHLMNLVARYREAEPS